MCNHVFTAYKLPQTEAPLLIKDEVKPFRDRIIAIINQKGGVAKTSTCLNLGISMSLLKKRVLLVDFDVQANLTISLGYKKIKSFYEVFQSDTNGLSGVIKKTKYPNLWLLPSNSNMALLTKKHSNKSNSGYLLRDKLNLVKDRFDLIIIDTPPSIEFFTLNALIASSFVIIPSQCEYFSTHGVDKVEKIIEIINQKTDQDIDYKILVTMYDAKSTSSKVIFAKLKSKYKEKAFNTIIELDNKIQESQILNVPVIYYDKESRSSTQYLNLAKEILGE
jgi:chromosome partitioning protein